MFLCDNPGNFECFQYFIFKINILKMKIFFTKMEHRFLIEKKRLKMQYFHIKLTFWKPMSRQTEWGLQTGPSSKSRVLLFFFEIFVSI